MSNAIVKQKAVSRQAQTERLREHLQKGNSINPLEAWRKLGIYRLSARIFDLREQGDTILGEFIEVKNQYGEPCHVKQYSLVRPT